MKLTNTIKQKLKKYSLDFKLLFVKKRDYSIEELYEAFKPLLHVDINTMLFAKWHNVIRGNMKYIQLNTDLYIPDYILHYAKHELYKQIINSFGLTQSDINSLYQDAECTMLTAKYYITGKPIFKTRADVLKHRLSNEVVIQNTIGDIQKYIIEHTKNLEFDINTKSVFQVISILKSIENGNR